MNRRSRQAMAAAAADLPCEILSRLRADAAGTMVLRRTSDLQAVRVVVLRRISSPLAARETKVRRCAAHDESGTTAGRQKR